MTRAIRPRRSPRAGGGLFCTGFSQKEKAQFRKVYFSELSFLRAPSKKL